jgi:hypothetical protein
MAGPLGPLLYGIFAVAAAGRAVGAALRVRYVIHKLGTKAAAAAAKQGKLVKKIAKGETIPQKYLKQESIIPKKYLEKHPKIEKNIGDVIIAGGATLGYGTVAKKIYDTEKKKRSQIAAKKKTGHTDHRTGGMFYKSGNK